MARPVGDFDSSRYFRGPINFGFYNVGIEGRGALPPRLHSPPADVWKRWLSGNHSAHWATTDAICGALVGPLLLAHMPRLERDLRQRPGDPPDDAALRDRAFPRGDASHAPRRKFVIPLSQRPR